MSEHLWLKVAGAAGTLLSIGGVLISLGIYVENLTNQIEASRSEVQLLKGQVTQLQDILQKTQAASVSGMRGPKGEKGDQGEQGLRGERGPQGEPGPSGNADSISEASVAKTVREIVSAEIATALMSGPQSSSATNHLIDTSGGFDLSKCILIDDAIKQDAITVTKGTEFCDKSGMLLTQVSDIANRRVYFMTPGIGSGSTGQTDRDHFRWDKGRKFYPERFSEDDKGRRIAVLRFVSE
jgi:hypothetical protein